MARRWRRARFGASAKVHNTAATVLLDELRKVLTDVETSSGSISCPLVVNQLHVLNHMHGEATAHIQAMGMIPSFMRELDRSYNRIADVEKHFKATCLRAK